MVRFHLNVEDLAKVRISPAGPFTEVCLSIVQTQQRRPEGLLDGWRQSLRTANGRWEPLQMLLPPSPAIDLHTIVGSAPTMDQALELVEAAPTSHLRQELEPLQPRLERAAPWLRQWVRALADGDRQVRRELVELLRDYHRRAIAPYWDGLQAHLEAERARRLRVLGDGGIEQLLATLHPRIRWISPVLEVGGGCDVQPDGEAEYVLDGRSIVIVPTVFGLGSPQVVYNVADPAAPFVLTYPALRRTEEAALLWTPRRGSNRSGLALAFGATRARALEAIADSCTTSELARRLGTSPSTASDHAYKLRKAGLVQTERIGNAVLHSLTPLGRALLEENRPERR